MSTPLDRVIRSLACIAWLYFGWRVAFAMPEGDRLSGTMGALACWFTALLLAVHAITGVSPIRNDET